MIPYYESYKKTDGTFSVRRIHDQLDAIALFDRLRYNYLTEHIQIKEMLGASYLASLLNHVREEAIKNCVNEPINERKMPTF